MARIAFRGVTKRYADGTEAVSGLDLEIADGELMVLVGPSGCGKSTALRMIAGLEDISEGEMVIGDEVVNHVEAKRRDIAMVFQNYALYPHMTVAQNMGFALRLARVDRHEIARRVERAAGLLDLGDQLHRKPANLSGGQRQRVAMGRAIVREPRAFLMDEPLSNLDAKLRVQMRASVARLQQQLGATMVYVTHDQTEAMTLGHRVAVLRRGVLQQVDTPAALYERPTNLFVAGFIGSPAMSFLPARIEDDALRLPTGDVALTSRLAARLQGARPGQEVVAGIRPEHLEEAAPAPHGAERVHLRVRAELVESVGSDVYVHATVRGRSLEVGALTQLAEDAGAPDASHHRDGEHQLVARLLAGSGARAGTELDLTLDPDLLALFDARTGASLLAPAPDSRTAVAR